MMDRTIFEQFPDAMRSLVTEIEEHAAVRIGFAPLPPQLAHITERAALNIVREPGKIISIEILLASGSSPPLHMIGHEVLHAGRSVVEGVESLLPRSERNMTLAIAISNDAEHLSVIPREIEHFPEARDYWARAFTSDLRTLWERYAADPTGAGIGRDLLRFWMVTNKIFPKWEGLEILADMLRMPERTKAAERLLSSTASASDYPRLIAAIIRSQGKMRGDFYLLDAEGKRRAIPSH